MSEQTPKCNYVYQLIPVLPDWKKHRNPPIYAVAGPDVDDGQRTTWEGQLLYGITKSAAERIARNMNHHWCRVSP